MPYTTIDQYLKRRRRQTISITAFSSLLLAMIIAIFALIYLGSGPIILGTEMNSNGLVEYLCLGNGCEDFTRMDW